MHALLSRLTVSCLAGLALGCGSAPAQDSGGFIPTVDFGRRGEHRAFERICRYEVAVLPAVYVIFDLTLEHGGRGYSHGEQGVLFMPERDGHCPETGAVRASTPDTVSEAEAAIEFARSFAFTRPSTRSTTGVVLYRPNPDQADARDRFTQFGLDVGALAANDMLPATHGGAANGVVCLEGPDIQSIHRHIIESDIADPADLLTTFHDGSCREITAEATGRSWPEVEAF